MKLDFGYLINKGPRGFRDFLKSTLPRIEEDIITFENKSLLSSFESPEKYSLAITIKKKYSEYVKTLSMNELLAIEQTKYKRKEIELDDETYKEAFDSALLKYESFFFKKSLYGKIDPFRMGLLIRSIREHYHVTRKEIVNATGYSYPKVRHIEMGNTLPSLDFLLKYCEMFGCSIDEIVKNSKSFF